MRVSLPNSRQRPPSDEQLSFGGGAPKAAINLKNYKAAIDSAEEVEERYEPEPYYLLFIPIT